MSPSRSHQAHQIRRKFHQEGISTARMYQSGQSANRQEMRVIPAEPTLLSHPGDPTARPELAAFDDAGRAPGSPPEATPPQPRSLSPSVKTQPESTAMSTWSPHLAQ